MGFWKKNKKNYIQPGEGEASQSEAEASQSEAEGSQENNNTSHEEQLIHRKDIPKSVLGDPQALSASSKFSVKEIKKLVNRFHSMMDVKTCSITSKHIENMSALRLNPFIGRLIHMKCEDTSRISFESFVSILSILSIKTEFEEKKKVLFEIFDHDRDGFISAQDYYTTLAPRMNPLFGQEEWKHIAKNIIQSKIADIPGSPSGLALSDFTSIISTAEVISNFTVEF